MRYKILPFFLPHLGCPHKCVFCDQKTITGDTLNVSIQKISKQIEAFGSDPGFTPSPEVFKEVAFYGSSFTAIPEKLQRSLLEPAFNVFMKKQIDGIRISTRPDYCDTNTIKLLKEYCVKTVELGVQSMDPEVLLQSGRGHGPKESVLALKALKNEGFITGIQLMPGLPSEDTSSFHATILKVISLKPEFVRLYPALVIRGTPLEKLFRRGLYNPLSLHKAVDLCRDGILLLRKSGIKVIRCGLQPTPSLQKKGSICAGPFHPAFGELVESAIVFYQVSKSIKRNIYHSNFKESVIIMSSPRRFSILKGQKGRNLERLRSLYPNLKIFMRQDPLLPDSLIRIEHEKGHSGNIQNPKTNKKIKMTLQNHS